MALYPPLLLIVSDTAAKKIQCHRTLQSTPCALEEPPSRPPVQLFTSPPAASGRRKVISVETLDVPTFHSINMDGSSLPLHFHHHLRHQLQRHHHADHLSATSSTTALTARTVADVSTCAVSTMAAIVASLGSTNAMV